MQKNLIPLILKEFGLEHNEYFKIKGYDDGFFYFGDNCLKYTTDDGYDEDSDHILPEIITGDAEIIKFPWKPHFKDFYWYIDENNLSKSPELKISKGKWSDSFYEILLFKAGLVFKTKEEAESALYSTAKEIGWGYGFN